MPPALPGGSRGASGPVDVVQSGIDHDGWYTMVPDGSVAPRRMSREEFASLVAHELRNPLNAMAGWLHLLSADASLQGDAARRALGGLRRALDQQIAQVDTLRKVLRLPGEPGAGEHPPLDLAALVHECVDALRPGAEAAGHAVHAEIRSTPVRVAGDRQEAKLALCTLGSFALRHGMPGAALGFVLTEGPQGAPDLLVSIDEGEDDGLSIWHGFGGEGSRLSLDLLHATLVLESLGASVGPQGTGRVGDVLRIRFEPSRATASGATASNGRAPEAPAPS